jgi:nicotinamidase-related amidase
MQEERMGRSGLASLTTAVLAVLSSVVLGGPSAAAQSQIELPTIPPPVAVTLDRSRTALLSLDFVEVTCSDRFPACLESIPSAASMLARARAEGLFIVHTGSRPQLPEVAPIDDETVIPGLGPDKFVGTNLDIALRRRGIDTLIIQGFASNRAVMYTAMDATMRGYTVVVPVDAAPSIGTPFDTLVAEYQLLTQTGRVNPDNEPLADEGVTLTRTDLISFR